MYFFINKYLFSSAIAVLLFQFCSCMTIFPMGQDTFSFMISTSPRTEVEKILCTRESDDNSTCFFSNIDNSFGFYQELNEMVDNKKSEIKKIYFKNSEMKNIPKELTDKFINLETLDASQLRLARLEKIDFFSFCKIKYLNASHNKISDISSTNIPPFMNRLINLDLSHNVIDRIDDDAFTLNVNLKYLNLSHNRIGKISTGFLKVMQNLEILKLDNNRITEITGFLSGIQMNLIELHLQNNNLKKFNPSIFPLATYLDLSFNDLEDVLDVSGSSFLSQLNIKSNLLSHLKINKKLQFLDASDNEEKSFKINFNENKILSQLNLSNLDIPNYGKILKDISSLSNLTFLDFSKNSLEIFNFEEAKLPPSIEFLNLRQCSIYLLENWKNLIIFLPKLKSIDIRGNYLHCDDLLSIVKKYLKYDIIAGFDENIEENEFIAKNCASDHHKHKELEHSETKSENKILWLFLIICLLGYVIGALFYANKRFNIFNRVVTRSSGNGFIRHEFEPTTFNLQE